MKTYTIPHTNLAVSRIGYGCAQLANWDTQAITGAELSKAERILHAAYECGITLFDHADLYAFGKSESVFGAALKHSPKLRDKIVIQSKCGQRFPDGWKAGDAIQIDLSRQHIVSSVEGILRRLSTDRLDILLLHAADALMQPEEVAQAFDDLKTSGKVRYFGVSNHNAAQIRLLKKSVTLPIVVNQIRLGLSYLYPLIDGMDFSLQLTSGSALDGGYTGLSSAGTLDYCRLHDIQIQAWSPLRGLSNPSSYERPELRRAAQLLTDFASEKEATPSAVALAWLLRHPAGILPIIGPSNPAHIIENCEADRISLSRDEWYRLFSAAVELQPLLINRRIG
jgi:predicted oxidoreductase